MVIDINATNCTTYQCHKWWFISILQTESHIIAQSCDKYQFYKLYHTSMPQRMIDTNATNSVIHQCYKLWSISGLQMVSHINATNAVIGSLHWTGINTRDKRQDGRRCADNIFKIIFLNENVWVSVKISLTFVPNGPINYIPALVQIMAWRQPGDKPLSGPMMVRLPTHICITRPQWVNAVYLEWSTWDTNPNTWICERSMIISGTKTSTTTRQTYGSPY